MGADCARRQMCTMSCSSALPIGVSFLIPWGDDGLALLANWKSNRICLWGHFLCWASRGVGCPLRYRNWFWHLFIDPPIAVFHPCRLYTPKVVFEPKNEPPPAISKLYKRRCMWISNTFIVQQNHISQPVFVSFSRCIFFSSLFLEADLGL